MATTRWSLDILKSLDKDMNRLNKQLFVDPSSISAWGFRSMIPRGLRQIFPEVVFIGNPSYSRALPSIIHAAYSSHLLFDRSLGPTNCIAIDDFLDEMRYKYPLLNFGYSNIPPQEALILGELFSLVAKFKKQT